MQRVTPSEMPTGGSTPRASPTRDSIPPVVDLNVPAIDRERKGLHRRGRRDPAFRGDRTARSIPAQPSVSELHVRERTTYHRRNHEIDYINVSRHGDAQNDFGCRAIKAAGDRSRQIPISSIKSMIAIASALRSDHGRDQS